jgi:hypothetical protein
MITNCVLLVVAIVATVVALALLVRGLCHDAHSRRMAKRAERFRPLTYLESRGRGCSLCR